MRVPVGDLWGLLALSLLLTGAGLRFAGLTRGSAEPVLPEHRSPSGGAAFYHFHPDEDTLIQSGLTPSLDWLSPPFTSYGVLPVYLLRGVLEVCGWDGLNLDDPDSARRAYYTGRVLAALFSCGMLWLVWRMGCRYFSRPAATLALAIAAFAPGAIQQAHFFIVDGLFGLLSVAAVHAALRAIEGGDRRWYALCGALVGATAAVRLNGLLLGPVLLAGHLAHRGAEEQQPLGRRLRRPELWLAGGLALLVLLLFEPFLLTDPLGLLGHAGGKGDFAMAVKIARGEILQPWTLVDVHTLPYLGYWSLFSAFVGSPLAILLLIAVVRLARKPPLPVVLMLIWCALYFLSIGSLHAKHVRYLGPLLPFLSLFAGVLLERLYRWQRTGYRAWLGKGLAGIAVLYLAVKGLAFARIYLEEDSRIQAGRWVAAQIPKGSKIGVENGAFSMQGFVSDRDHRHVILDVTRIFYTYPYFSCRAQVDFLADCLQDMDYLAFTDVNRHAQFTAVPDLFPVVAGLYERLVAGELGFELVQRFKVYPAFLGIEFRDDRAEPSFLGYDHPAVWIFRSRGKAALGEALARWEKQLGEHPCCPDRSLEQVAAQLRAGEWEQARTAAQSAVASYPKLALGYWLLAHTQQKSRNFQVGSFAEAESALARYRPENLGVPHVLNTQTRGYLPAHTALSFFYLGLPDQALQVLAEELAKNTPSSAQTAELVAKSYLDVAWHFSKAGDLSRMEKAAELSTRIYKLKEAHNIMAIHAQRRGEPQQALNQWEQSLLIDPAQADVHRRAGLVALLELGLPDKARYHLARAVALDPTLQAGITAALQTAQELR